MKTYYHTAAQFIRQLMHFNQVEIGTFLFDSMVHGHGSWGIMEFFWLWRFSFSFFLFCFWNQRCWADCFSYQCIMMLYILTRLLTEG